VSQYPLAVQHGRNLNSNHFVRRTFDLRSASVKMGLMVLKPKRIISIYGTTIPSTILSFKLFLRAFWQKL
jgi:hypothetical protein